MQYKEVRSYFTTTKETGETDVISEKRVEQRMPFNTPNSN